MSTRSIINGRRVWCATLAKRHHGVHRAIAHVYFPATDNLVTWSPDPLRGRVPTIDEDALLTWMPGDLIPLGERPATILLLAEHESGDGGSGAVGQPKRFRAWAKYFDAYSITVGAATMPADAVPGAIRRGGRS